VSHQAAVSERVIQRAVLRRMAELLPPQAFWFHVPNQLLDPERIQDAERYGRALLGDGLKPGVPDLLLLHRARCCALEIKRAGEYPSVVQLETHARMRAAGTPVALVRSADEAEDALRALRWLPPSPAPRALAGADRPLRSALAQLRRRGLAVPTDAAGTAWRRTVRGDAEAAK
jgi:hypothetical protein